MSTLSTLTETPGSNLPTAATNGYDPFWHPKTPEELAFETSLANNGVSLAIEKG